MPRLRIRSMGQKEPRFLDPGTACEAFFGGGKKCFPGIIVGTDVDDGGGKYHVRYDDGDEERMVPQSHFAVQFRHSDQRSENKAGDEFLM